MLSVTHTELVMRAARWLRNTQHCGVVLTEFASSSSETPDAIGWTAGGCLSYLVECKVSRSDFYRDKHKLGRGKRLNAGVGRLRYYLAPPGVLTPELVRQHRPKWGLLEVTPKTVRVRLRAEPFERAFAWRELPLLYSCARRWMLGIEPAWPRPSRQPKPSLTPARRGGGAPSPKEDPLLTSTAPSTGGDR